MDHTSSTATFKAPTLKVRGGPPPCLTLKAKGASIHESHRTIEKVLYGHTNMHHCYLPRAQCRGSRHKHPSPSLSLEGTWLHKSDYPRVQLLNTMHLGAGWTPQELVSISAHLLTPAHSNNKARSLASLEGTCFWITRL